MVGAKPRIAQSAILLACLATVLTGCSRANAPEAGSGGTEDATTTSSSVEETTAAVPALDRREVAMVARIVCEPSGEARVVTPRVAARPGGVHFVIDNRIGADTEYGYSESSGSSVPTTLGSGRAPAGESEHVKGFPPGEVQIVCYEPSARDYGRSAGNEQSYAEPDHGILEVVDPENVFRSAGLVCAEGETGTAFVYGAGGEGGEEEYTAEPTITVQSNDPVAIARHTLAHRLRPGDLVELAGYPESRDPDGPKVVRVVRDDRVVAAIEYLRDSGGDWTESSNKFCEEF